jgi:hypothetical protein
MAKAKEAVFSLPGFLRVWNLNLKNANVECGLLLCLYTNPTSTTKSKAQHAGPWEITTREIQRTKRALHVACGGFYAQTK